MFERSLFRDEPETPDLVVLSVTLPVVPTEAVIADAIVSNADHGFAPESSHRDVDSPALVRCTLPRAQLAREFGAYVIGTGRAAGRQTVLDFGAQEFVDLDNDTLEEIMRLKFLQRVR